VKLTNQECNRLGLPGRSPVEPFEDLDWYACVEETPAQNRPHNFEQAGAILGGDGERAA
jgi:hypothetical protein